MTNVPHFDLFQFSGKRSHAVSADTGISFQDFDRMHITHRAPAVARRQPIPDYALNDSLLRNTVLTLAERRLYIEAQSGASDADRFAAIERAAKFRMKAREQHVDSRLDAYKKAVDEGASAKRLRELRIQAQNADSRYLFDRRPVELLLNVAYLSYRLGMDSVSVAENLGIHPPAVRTLLFRLKRVADGLRTGRVYRQRGKIAGHSRPWTRAELVRLWFLRHSGFSYQQCGKKLGRLSRSGHSSNVRGAYLRYFEENAQSFRWTRARQQGLWVLHVTGRTWADIGKVLGISAWRAQAAHKRFFGGK
jgi:hypothetical protein